MTWLKYLLAAWVITSGISFIILWRLLYVQSKESERQRIMQAKRNWRMGMRVTMLEDELGVATTTLPRGDVPLITIRGRG